MISPNKKITRAIFKSFIKGPGLFIKQISSFNGMTDGIDSIKDDFNEIKSVDLQRQNTLGIKGLWLVGSSRDYFTYFNNGTFEGIEVYNSCGCSMVGRKITPGI